MTGRNIIITEIIKTRGNILHTTVKRNHISKEIVLEKHTEILPEPEMASKENQEDVQVTNTDHMELSVTTEILLHTEIMEEGNKAKALINLIGIEENPAALVIIITEMTEETDRVL